MPNPLDDFPDQLAVCAADLAEHPAIAKFYRDLASKIELDGVPHRYDLLEWIIGYDWP